MSEKIPSPQSLVARMTSFAYDYDGEFRSGHSDAMRMIRKTRTCVGIVDAKTDDPYKIYDERTIVFSAERENFSKKSKVATPSLFTARLDIVSQINALPGLLRRNFDEEQLKAYDAKKHGNLNTVQSVEYTVQTMADDVDIMRNIEYALRDDDAIVVYVTEADDPERYELVPVDHEQRTLRIPAAVTEERVSDEADQLIYNAQLDAINFGAPMDSEFEAIQNGEATLAILALLRSLKTGSKIPNNI